MQGAGDLGPVCPSWPEAWEMLAASISEGDACLSAPSLLRLQALPGAHTDVLHQLLQRVGDQPRGQGQA